MLMNTTKLVLLRIYNVTLGRFEIFSRLLKKILKKTLISNKRDRYTAASKFFDFKELENEKE